MSAAPADLSSDRPSTDPAADLYGHAPFARTLAKAIAGYRSSDGIVLGLYGPWGSGKSTVLAYVAHELAQLSEAERPVVVSFNPWWFSGQENLARAFLGQMQAVLPAKYERFKALGDKLGQFSEAIGSVGDVVGTLTGQGWLGGVLRGGTRLAARSPKNVPALKEALCKLLLEQRKRILVIVDDIDRLTPDEVRQLFTVIKALADFPYVTYLLAFDREVASAAINEQTGLPGERFLEKIIQVPFELPHVDRETLCRALFVKLDAVIGGTPEGRFDAEHWANLFYSGLDPLFRVPRDIVRLVNSLSVTYPAVVGEVNPVDFIAIEALRVFLPQVYDAVRRNPEQFAGHRAPSDGASKTEALAFHNAWLDSVPEPLRESTKAMAQRLFPRLESLWGNMHYSGDSAAVWRRQLRICTPELFALYFRLSLPVGAVSRAEVDGLMAVLNDPDALAEALRHAAQQKRADGMSKVRALLERLMDHVPSELTAAHAVPVIRAMMRVGDELILPGDLVRGDFDFGNESRVTRICYHLLKKVERTGRLALLMTTLNDGDSLRCSQYLFASLSDEATKAAKGEGDALLSVADTDQLKAAWLAKVQAAAVRPGFIDHPSIAVLLSGWRHWGSEAKTVAWWQEATVADDGLLKLIAAHKGETTSQTWGDYASRVQIRVNPQSLEAYGDVLAMANRVSRLLAEGKVAEIWRPAAVQFVRECEMLTAGKSPDAPFAFLDD